MKKWTALLLALALGCGLYGADYYRATETLQGSSGPVTVELTRGRAVFRPEEPEAGLIFYPGGKVEFTAYAPLMKKLAEENVLCTAENADESGSAGCGCGERDPGRISGCSQVVSGRTAAWRHPMQENRRRPMTV